MPVNFAGLSLSPRYRTYWSNPNRDANKKQVWRLLVGSSVSAWWLRLELCPTTELGGRVLATLIMMYTDATDSRWFIYTDFWLTEPLVRCQQVTTLSQLTAGTVCERCIVNSPKSDITSMSIGIGIS